MLRDRFLRMARREWEILWALPRNARVLLGTSSIFAFAMPVIYIFVSAFIMRNSRDMVKVMAYQIASYASIPLAFYANGLLLRRFKASTLYACGLALSGVVVFALTTISDLELVGVIVAGLVMGVSAGLHWSNRNLLALAYTRDDFRNYYFALEGFVSCVSGVVVPAVVGAFIVWCGAHTSSDAGVTLAYRIVAGVVMALSLAATWMVSRGNFAHLEAPVGVRLRYDRLWCGLLMTAMLRGMGHILQAALPVVMVMQMLGDQENVLGVVQSVGALAAAALVYVVGRKAAPRHRWGILAAALCAYACGAGINAFYFCSWTILLFLVCMLIAHPMIEFAYSPIQLRVMDRAVRHNRDSGYAHLCGFEMGLLGGRLLGGVIFVFFATRFPAAIALRCVLGTLALAQLVSLPVAYALVSRLREASFEIEACGSEV